MRKCNCGKTIQENNISGRCIKCLSIKHGLSYTQFYASFRSLRQRCKYENHKQYKNYGGRGIKCEWLCFDDFIKDMYDEYHKFCNDNPGKKVSIERINVNGNYCKENCTWIDKLEQAKNRRGNRYITYNGVTDTIGGRAKKIGINRVSLLGRLNRGRSIEKAIGQKEKRKKKSIIIKGEEYFVEDIMNMLGVGETTAYRYINNQSDETIEALHKLMVRK